MPSFWGRGVRNVQPDNVLGPFLWERIPGGQTSNAYCDLSLNSKILHGEADMFIHLSAKLKIWDTAGPAAIAKAAGLEVSRLEEDGLPFDLSHVQHNSSVIIGRPGSVAWCRKYLRKPE